MLRKGERKGRGGLVARLFCLASSQPLEGLSPPQRISSASSTRARAPKLAPGEEQTTGADGLADADASPAGGPLTPTGSAALSAYLGSASLVPPSTPSHGDAEAAASGWTSCDSAGSRGSSGAATDSAAGGGGGDGSGGGSPRYGGYEADSDDTASDIYSPRRFRPAVRRPNSSSAASAAAGEEAALACVDADAPPSPATSFSSAQAGARPSRSSSSHSLSTLSTALSGASSLSFAHFLRGRSFGARSRRTAGPQHEPPSPADSLALGLPTAEGAAAAAAGGAGGAGDGVVQRTLSNTLEGHYISLEKLRQQCGNIEEPPSDLLSLMARRVLSSRSALLHRLQEEGAAAAPAAAAPRPASPGDAPTGLASPATTPRFPPTTDPAGAGSEHQAAAGVDAGEAAAAAPLQEQVQAQLQQLPLDMQLPRIKTKIGQRCTPTLQPAA
ncbi:DNA (cytosine-5)-methyltransferase 1B [Micractinium conductrix]|uniref:DNA (Cytosine-5)-methyltransferase 1B n=1 Tax=Micractinium conductrix TaxID=554055 RepID=A0A2P6UZU2_9CHLO|nr:DNA (cytosine-5)-methyltransferase 1B [Micractinium conductrix]|eukprot:PSC67367.1 DNA (cytosine-5)-methyltransferase 1B [Micractinium conductrix]